MSGGAKITDSSVVSLGLVIVLAGGIWAASQWATGISIRLEAIEKAVSNGTGDRWTGADMRAWVQDANREVELWSLEAERNLGLEHGAWRRLCFPEPVHSK